MIFDNRRVLHARTEFVAPQAEGKEGLRWLIGCYLDESSVNDTFRILGEEFEYADA